MSQENLNPQDTPMQEVHAQEVTPHEMPELDDHAQEVTPHEMPELDDEELAMVAGGGVAQKAAEFIVKNKKPLGIGAGAASTGVVAGLSPKLDQWVNKLDKKRL